MNESHLISEIVVSEARPLPHTSAAKARLLAWAEEHDARKLKARSSVGAIATRGALALLGGMVIVRLLTPHRRDSSRSRVTSAGARLINWALVARASTWLLPHVIRAVQNHPKRPVPG